MRSEEAHKAAERLAAILNPEPWYHRTSVLERKADSAWIITIEVWGVSKQRPVALPSECGGFPVAFRSIKSGDDCPFGSVKAEG